MNINVTNAIVNANRCMYFTSSQNFFGLNFGINVPKVMDKIANIMWLAGFKINR